MLQQCFAFSVLFGYIASSPFIYQKIYGLSSIGYSVMFGINACGIGLGAVVSSKMMNPERVLVFGSAGLVLFSLLVGGSLLTGASLWLLEPCFFLLLVSLGTTFPTASSIAMSRQRKMAGAASAVLGASGFVAGGIVSPLGRPLLRHGLHFNRSDRGGARRSRPITDCQNCRAAGDRLPTGRSARHLNLPRFSTTKQHLFLWKEVLL